MFANAKDFSGTSCASFYERELQIEFQDRLFFYIDGKIRFERGCYGESAGLVFEVWASGFDENGKIQWIDKPKYDSYVAALPTQLTDIQEEGNALQFDGQFKRFLKTGEIKSDKERGYTKLKLMFCKRNRS